MSLEKWHPSCRSCHECRTAAYENTLWRNGRLLERRWLGQQVIVVSIPGLIQRVLTLWHMTKEPIVYNMPAQPRKTTGAYDITRVDAGIRDEWSKVSGQVLKHSGDRTPSSQSSNDMPRDILQDGSCWVDLTVVQTLDQLQQQVLFQRLDYE